MVLLSVFRQFYAPLRKPDESLNNLAELVDRKFRPNLQPVDGVYSFDLRIGKSRASHQGLQAPSGWGGSTKSFELSKASEIRCVCSRDHLLSRGELRALFLKFDIYDIFCCRIVKVSRSVVVSVGYRLSPANKFPCGYGDGMEAVKWVQYRHWLRSGKDYKVSTYLVLETVLGVI
ncbi:gibberellin receptor GID1B-like [Papaver somniferum]|uniref:gibberellin receptor GID1B-like n=1 Tax=Papaver somniferum TaxID=3469 RepID=UPI000E6F7F74|nr:gibberellin receptor GID1B-like [Papaver somniferum]